MTSLPKYLVALAAFVSLLLVVLHVTGKLGQNDSSSKYDMLRPYADKIMVRYLTTPTMLTKSFTYILPDKFDGLEFVYEAAQAKELVTHMEVVLTKSDGKRTSSGILSLSKFPARARGSLMVGDLGQALVLPGGYFGYPEGHPEFIEMIEVNLSWARPSARTQAFMMPRHSALAQALFFDIVPIQKKRLDRVEMVRDNNNVFGPANR